MLLDDGCAAFSPEIHEATLLSFQGPFGRVRTADEVLALLKGGEVLPVVAIGNGPRLTCVAVRAGGGGEAGGHHPTHRGLDDLRPGLRLRDSLGHSAWQHEQYVGKGEREL